MFIVNDKTLFVLLYHQRKGLTKTGATFIIKYMNTYSNDKMKLPAENELYDLAELFKVFGDSTRIRILFVLHEGEVCVQDIADALQMTQSAVSHQLKILKQSKLVGSRREGKQIFYFLADDHVLSIIDLGLEHLRE